MLIEKLSTRTADVVILLMLLVNWRLLDVEEVEMVVEAAESNEGEVTAYIVCARSCVC